MKKRYFLIALSAVLSSALLFGCGDSNGQAASNDNTGSSQAEVSADADNADAQESDSSASNSGSLKECNYNPMFDELIEHAPVLEKEFLTFATDDQIKDHFGEPVNVAEMTYGDLTNYLNYYGVEGTDYANDNGLLVCLEIRNQGMNYYHISACQDNYNYLIDYMQAEGKWNVPAEYIEPIFDISGERDAAYHEYMDPIYDQYYDGDITKEEYEEIRSEYQSEHAFIPSYTDCVEAFGNEGLFFAVDDDYFKVAWYIPSYGSEYADYEDQVLIFCFNPETGIRGGREGWTRRSN